MTQIVDTENLSALIPGLVSGRQDAFRDLVHATSRPLLRYALSLTRNESSAQDAVQETYMRVYRARKTLAGVTELRGYLFRVVRNVSHSEGRSTGRRRRREQEAVEMRNHTDNTPDQQALAREAWEQLSTLPEQFRSVLELRFAHGLNRAEVAAALELPEGTVATRQRSGLEKLKALLASAFTAPALPALDLPALLNEGATLTAPSSESLTMVHSVEEFVMAGIRRIKFKTAGSVAAAALVALLLVSVGGVSAVSALNDSEAGGESTSLASAGKPDSSGRQTPLTASSQPTRHGASDTGTELDENTPVDLASNSDDPSSSPATTPDLNTTPDSQPEVVPENEATPDATPEPTPVVTEAPRFLSEPSRIAPIDVWYNHDVLLAGQPAPQIELLNAPAWLSLVNRRLVGTPERMDAGLTDWIILRADNNVAPRAEQRFQLLVGSAPAFASSAVEIAVAGDEYRYAVKLTGEPAPTLSAEGLPAWLDLKDGVLTGVPEEAGVGGPITLTASNGIKPNATQKFNITVAKVVIKKNENETEEVPGVKRGPSVAPEGTKVNDDDTHELGHVTRGKLKRWIKKGFEFEWTYSANEHAITPEEGTRTLEILSVADDAIEIEVVTRLKSNKWKKVKEKKTCTLEELTLELSPVAIPDMCVEETVEVLVLDKTDWDCRKFYETPQDAPEDHGFDDYYHFSKKYPGLLVKFERKDTFDVYNKKTDDYDEYDEYTVQTWTLKKVKTPKGD